MANHQNNYTSNFEGQDPAGDAGLSLFVNGGEYAYRPSGSDTTVYIPTVEKHSHDYANIVYAITRILAAGGSPIVTKLGAEFTYTSGDASTYKFVNVSGDNITEMTIDRNTGTVTTRNNFLARSVEVTYGVDTASYIAAIINTNGRPYVKVGDVISRLYKIEVNKYTFRTTHLRTADDVNYLDIVDYIVTGSSWTTVTKTVSGGNSGSAYLKKVSSPASFDTTGLSGLQTVAGVNDVPTDGVYQVSVMLSVTPKTANATKSDLVFGFYGTDGIGMADHTFHAVVDDSQTFAQQLSFSTTLNLKAGTNSLKLSCDGLNTNYLVFVDDLTVAQLVNGVYHNGDDFSDVHTLTEAADFNNDDGVLVDGATGGPRFMLWRTLANKVLGFIKSLSTTITAFRTGDVIPVDGLSGTAKMSKDDLLRETAENTLSTMLKSVGLNDTNYWFIGGIVSSSGKYNPDYADRLVTDFLKIEKYQTITFTKPAGVSFYYNVYCYDSNYNYLGYVATLHASMIYSTYPSTCFIRFGFTSISGATVAVSNLANIVVFSANILCYDIASEEELKKANNDISSLAYKTDHLFDDSSIALDLNDTQYWQNGGLDSSSGTETVIADRLRTIFLMLTGTSTILYNKKTGVNFNRSLYCYDKNKIYLGYSNTTSIATAITTYPTAVWFRIGLTGITGATVDYTNISNIFTWKAGLFEVVEGYESRLKNLEDLTGGFIYHDPLKGKKWYACGDSFTAGATGGTITADGPYKGYKCVYPYFIGNRTAMEVHNIAVSGSTMTYKSGTSTASNCFSYPSTGKYLSIPSDADYITLKFGINDDPSHEDMPLGTINDNTNETLYGAWNVVISYLVANCPHAKIGIIVSNGCYDPDYSKAARDIAEKWGLGYLDENFDYKVPLLIRVTGKPNVSSAAHNVVLAKMRVSESNTHPNDWAHEYESTIVEAWLRSL